MKEWEYDALREECREEISNIEVECYEDGRRVEDGNPENKETFLDIWFQCPSCGNIFKNEDEATDCCFPKYHVDCEE
ncbi:MAG: hypothetical protein WC248_06360 [Candidatus Methanomethylophilaceae archaeon]|jgi:hypothetical protein